MSADTGAGATTGRLADRRIVVVGAGSVGDGLSNGCAAAEVFAREGARVLAVDRDGAAAEATVARVEAAVAGATVVAFRADVTDGAERIARAAVERLGGLDGVHYNAGISRPGGLAAETEADWAAVLEVNVTGAWRMARAAAPLMERGAFTFVSSVAAIRGSPYAYTSYEVSKAALGRLARSLAVELAPRGIRANTILPGLIETPHAAHYVAGGRDLETFAATRAALPPLGRQGTPWDVAEAAAWLLSDAAAYVTGVDLVVDGGLSLVGPR